MYDLSKYEIDEDRVVNDNNANLMPIKKRSSFWRNFGIAFLVFTLAVAIVARAISMLVLQYNNEYGLVQEMIEYLNEPVSDDLKQNHLTESHYTSFVSKVESINLDIFENDTINLNKEGLELGSVLTLTNYEFGALLLKLLEQESEDIYDYITLKDISILLDVANYKIITVVELNLSDVKSAIGGLLSDLPNTIYVTTTSNVVIVNNFVTTISTQLQINELDGEKNDKLVSFFSSVFGGNDEDLGLLEIVTHLISEQLNDFATKTNSSVGLNENTVTFTPIVEE